MSEPLPERIGPYEIIRLLGMGGMAQVYHARKMVEGVGLVVALKIPRQHIVMDVAARERFLKEARITARMGSHANITQILDVGVDGELPYMAMEYVTGVDLGQLCEAMVKARTRWSEPAILWVLASVVQGLKHAWGAEVAGEPLRIVHRDISPSNVLVTHEGYVKVTDFGISRMAGMDTSGSIRGKARYMPCEQLQGRATSASDMYAVGAIGWELIEGKKFRHDKFTQDEMFLAAFAGERPEITREGISPRLVELVHALLDPNEKARIQNPLDAWAELKSCPGLNLADPDPVRMLLEEFFGQRRRSGHTAIHVFIHPELVATRAALAAVAEARKASGAREAAEAEAKAAAETPPPTPESAPPADEPPPTPGSAPPVQAAAPVQATGGDGGTVVLRETDAPVPRSRARTVRSRSAPAPAAPSPSPSPSPSGSGVRPQPESGPTAEPTEVLVGHGGPVVGSAPAPAATGSGPTPVAAMPEHAGAAPASAMAREPSVPPVGGSGPVLAASTLVSSPTLDPAAVAVVGPGTEPIPAAGGKKLWPIWAILGVVGLVLGVWAANGLLGLLDEPDQAEPEVAASVASLPVGAPADRGAPAADAGDDGFPAMPVDPVASELVITDDEAASSTGRTAELAGDPEAGSTSDGDAIDHPSGADESDADIGEYGDDSPAQVEPSSPTTPRTKPKATPRVEVHVRLGAVGSVELRIGSKIRVVTGDTTLRMRTGSKRLAVRAPGTPSWYSSSVRLEPGKEYLLRLYAKSMELHPL